MDELHSYRVYSFQSQQFVDNLLTDGIVRTYSWCLECEKSKKYCLYAPLLNGLEEDTLPIFTFLKFNNDYVEYPISAQSISDNWSTFMRWFRLSGRCILELEIPKEVGVIGEIEGCNVLDFNNDTNEKYLEFVVPYIKLDWVREIYKPIENIDNITTLKPLINKFEDRLFSTEFKMGSYKRVNRYDLCKTVNIEDYLKCNKPIIGMSYGYNVSRLTLEDARKLIDYGMKKHFNDVYNDCNDELWNLSIEKLLYMTYNKD